MASVGTTLRRVFALPLGLGLLPLPLILLSSCSTLSYYGQSISGHIGLMSRAKPVEAVLERGDPPPGVRAQLMLSQQVRDFAVEMLHLPDNGSYRRYADLGRPYVVWNVVATPELSLEPKNWCFLFVGCLAYRGYFNRDDADSYAAELRAQGMDVQVSGARAYSTLGWFDDPLLSTMLSPQDWALIDVIIHELAHQKVYIKGDSPFNEAFATAVAHYGVQRWFETHNQPEAYAEYALAQERKVDFHTLLATTRQRLKGLYASSLPEEQKREGKKAVFARLREDYAVLKASWGGYGGYDAWMAREINNAHLALFATYHELVPAFLAMLRLNQGDLNAFYAQAESLDRLSREARHLEVASYLPQAPAVQRATFTPEAQ